MNVWDVLYIAFVAIPTVIWTLILFYLAFGELTAPWRARRDYKRRLAELQRRGR